MNQTTTTPHDRSASTVLGRALLAMVIAALMGAVTALSAPFLDEQLGRVVNAPWEWTAIVFALVWWSRARPWPAAALGTVAFLLLNVGFALGAAFAQGNGYAISAGNFWVVVGFVAGPVVGVGASWVRHRHDALAALGLAGLAGVVLGDGWNGLTLYPFVSPGYWLVLIATGVAVLASTTAARLPGAPVRATAVVAAVLLALVYHLATVAYVGGPGVAAGTA